MLREFVCIERCFWHDGLRDVGAIVLADSEEMKGNSCFKPSKQQKQEKAEITTPTPTPTPPAPAKKEIAIIPEEVPVKAPETEPGAEAYSEAGEEI